jgi:hypothetical protein
MRTVIYPLYFLLNPNTPNVALVFSRLDYCNAVLAGLPAATLAPLQPVLHAAARLVNCLRPCDHVTSTLKELHWLPIAQRIDYKLCLRVHKSIIGNVPVYLTNLLTAVADDPSRSALRDASNGDFVIPKMRLELGERGVFLLPPLSLGTACRPYLRLCDRQQPSNAA